MSGTAVLIIHRNTSSTRSGVGYDETSPPVGVFSSGENLTFADWSREKNGRPAQRKTRNVRGDFERKMRTGKEIFRGNLEEG